MKKYCQLLLFLASILSLTLLLVYRHQYNRLHYVLEVFNFFGQPCNISDLEFGTNIAVQHDWGPTPLWQTIGPTHTYSGFWTKKNEAKVIVTNKDKIFVKGCYLWYENANSPLIGKFSYTKHSNLNDTRMYFYNCQLPNYEHFPYAVSFGTKAKYPLTKIFLKSPSEKISFNTTVCVLPSMNFSKHEFLEFLSFHMLIGIDSYIFYTDNISHRLQKIIMNLSSRLNIKITFFPWNLNIYDNNLIYEVINQDCIYRAFPNSVNIITLSLSDYLVPSAHITFNEILHIFKDKSQTPNLRDFKSTQVIRLPVQRFCIKNLRLKKPIALQNTEVTYFNDNSVREIRRNVDKGDVIKPLNKHIAVYSYIRCNQTGRTYNDNTMLRYSTDFLRSTLMQLYLHDHI